MERLWVLYDATCGFCVRCRDWLQMQRQLVPLVLRWAGDPEVEARFPGAVRPGPRELVVVGEDGAIWRDTSAWLMCLWALEDWRDWSYRLAHPTLLPLARRAFEAISSQRKSLSWFFGLEAEDALVEALGKPLPLASTGDPKDGARCGYCLTNAKESARSCERCGSILHDDCFSELGRCPTLGCRDA